MPLNTVLGGRSPHVVAILPGYIASCQINVVKPLTALARAGHIKLQHVSEHKAKASHIRRADLVVFCRNTEPGFAYLLSEAIGRHKPVIYDIDDSFWDISASTDPDLARYHLQPSRLRQLEQYLSNATLVRVYSPLMKTKADRFSKNVRTYRSGFDFSLLPDYKRIEPRARNAKVGIVYATSRIVDDQYKIFLPALEQFLLSHSDSVEMTVWGCSPPELLTLPGVVSRKLVSNYDDFLRDFSRAEFEIGLAPLADNEFNRAKNNTKFRDYGACQIAGIYSDLDVYSSSVRNEHSGLLVQNTRESWYQALRRLVFDEQLRNKIRNNAWTQVYEGYRQEFIAAQWLQDIHELLSEVPSYWLAKLSDANTMKVRFIAEHDNLCGVRVRDLRRNGAKIYLELVTVNGFTLRQKTSFSTSYDTTSGTIDFDFQTVKNSSGQIFDLRLSGLTRVVSPENRVQPLYEKDKY